MHLLALANGHIEGPNIPVGHCSYCASLSRKILVLLLPLVLLLLLLLFLTTDTVMVGDSPESKSTFEKASPMLFPFR